MTGDTRLEDKYRALLGKDVSDDEIMEVYRIADALQIGSFDSMWTVLIALRYHVTLYRQIPDEIATSAATILEKFRESADAELQASVQSAQTSLAAAVVKSAEKVAAHASRKSASRWMIAAVTIITAATIAVGAAGFYFGDKSGFARGFAGAREEAAAATWAATPAGAKAYQMHLSGALEKVTNCSGGPAWEIIDGMCYPHPDPSSGQMKTNGWKLP